MAIVFQKDQRIILIEAPTVDVTVQELLTAIRNYEDSIVGMDIYKIADATGKEELGGGLFVGITLQLINWTLQFEARGGPDYVLCDVGSGNLLAVSGSTDLGTLVFVNPIEPSAFTTVTKTSAVSAALLNAATLPADVADAVWDESVADHQIIGSTGEALGLASSGSIDLDTGSIADAVWDENLNAHQQAGSTGEALKQAALGSGSMEITASVDIATIVSGVWDASKVTFDTPGSFGNVMNVVSQSIIEVSGTVNTILETTYTISSSVVENGLLLQQISQSVNSIDSSSIADAVWDEILSEHQLVGSTGEALSLAASGSASIDISSIVDGVWNAQQSDYVVAGSFGELLGVVSQSIVQTSESVNLLYDNVVYISSSVDQNGVYLQQVSQSVNLIYDQTSYITSSVDDIYIQTTDISQSVNTIDSGSIADAVWDEKLADHTGSVESAGYALANVSSGASPALIADAVWDEILSEHTGSEGSAGARMGFIYGLLQNNFRMLNQVYDSNNLMTSATLRVYSNSVDADADTNPLKEWTVTAVYTNGNLTNYLVKE
jgi:isochorismate hydrolase